MSEEIKKKIEEKAKEYSQTPMKAEYKGMEAYMAQDFEAGAEFGYQLAQEDHPNQDELWEEFFDFYFENESLENGIEEAKKRYRITRVK